MSQPVNERGLTVGSFLSLFFYGFTATLAGPALREIASDLNLDYSLQGSLFSGLLGGYAVATFGGGFLADKVGRKTVLLVGLLMLIAMSVCFGLSPTYYVALGSIILIGASGGFVEGATNALVVDVNPDKSGLVLNLLHAFYSIGAFLAPLFIGLLLAKGFNWRVSYLSVAGFTFALFVVMIFQRFPKVHKQNPIGLGDAGKLFKKPVLLILAICLGLYLGAEIGLQAWMVSYLQKDLNISQFKACSTLSTFWLTIILGRLLCGFLSKKVGTASLILISVLVAAVTLSVALGLKHQLFTPILIGFSGLFFAGVFPLILALAQSREPRFFATAMGAIMGFAALGGLILPWLIGRIAETYSIGAGLWLIIAFLLSIALILAATAKAGLHTAAPTET